jgi:hypothetical protein
VASCEHATLSAAMRNEWSIFLRRAFLLKAFPEGRVPAYAIPRIIARQSLSRERHLCAIMESVLAQGTGPSRHDWRRSKPNETQYRPDSHDTYR